MVVPLLDKIITCHNNNMELKMITEPESGVTMVIPNTTELLLINRDMVMVSLMVTDPLHPLNNLVNKDIPLPQTITATR